MMLKPLRQFPLLGAVLTGVTLTLLTPPVMAQGVPISAGQGTTWKMTTIKGHVLTDQGKPLKVVYKNGVRQGFSQVYLAIRQSYTGAPTPSLPNVCLLDAQGYYNFRCVPGEYTLIAAPDGYRGATKIVRIHSGQVQTIDFRCHRDPHVHGPSAPGKPHWGRGRAVAMTVYQHP